MGWQEEVAPKLSLARDAEAVAVVSDINLIRLIPPLFKYAIDEEKRKIVSTAILRPARVYNELLSRVGMDVNDVHWIEVGGSGAQVESLADLSALKVEILKGTATQMAKFPSATIVFAMAALKVFEAHHDMPTLIRFLHELVLGLRKKGVKCYIVFEPDDPILTHVEQMFDMSIYFKMSLEERIERSFGNNPEPIQIINQKR